MVGTGILSNNMRPPSPECYTTFLMMTIYSDTLHWSGITSIFDPITDLDLITEFYFLPYCERFPWSICNDCGMPTEDAYSSGHLVLSFMGSANVLLLRPPTLNHQLMTHFPDFVPTLTLLLNIGFHRASATGVECRQGTFTPLDTWYCPTLGLVSVLKLRPISPELVLFPDFWVSNIPRYFCFSLLARKRKINRVFI